MQIFELHFNPKLKEKQVFDSFVYEPQNIYEKKLGTLYIIGELQNVLPQNLNLLNNLAQIIKKKYYALFLKTPERALSETLKGANEFLSEEVKKDNVGWLGNLNFSVLSLKDLKLTFTKTGNLKILLIRNGQIIDIGKNLDLQGIDPYPLKIFFDTASGKLIQNDILLVLTKEVLEFFHQQNILFKIARLEAFDEKKLKEILPPPLFTKGEGAKISGICFLTIIKKEISPIKKPEKIFFQKEENFALSQIIFSSLKPFQKINPIKFVSQLFNRVHPVKSRKTGIEALNALSARLFNRVNFRLEAISSQVKSLSKPFTIFREKIVKSKSSNIKKKLILILLLILFLFSGFLMFKKREEKKDIEIKNSLNRVQEKVNKAENFLIFKNEAKASSLLGEAWQEISLLTEKRNPFKAETLSLKQSIKENLENLNKLEKIENPEEVSELEYKKRADSLTPPENLIPPPESDFNFDLFASYFSNLYFLDKKTCKIIKYPYLEASNWGPPQTWKEPDNNCFEPKSMAIDGSIWILNGDNSIIRYHSGSFQEKINLDFFPFPEDIIKIKTKPNLPYLYLLEPGKKRIIIIDKEGKIIKQFQSEKFDDLKDFIISENGKTIWLLNGLKVYQIKL